MKKEKYPTSNLTRYAHRTHFEGIRLGWVLCMLKKYLPACAFWPCVYMLGIPFSTAKYCMKQIGYPKVDVYVAFDEAQGENAPYWVEYDNTVPSWAQKGYRQ